MSLQRTLSNAASRLLRPGQGYGATRNVPARPTLDITKSARETLDSDLTPSDFVDAGKYREPQDERTLVNLVLKRYSQAAYARRTHEAEWLLCTAFEAGNQWVEWRSVTNRLESIRDKADPYRSYHTDNQIRPIVERMTQRATQSKPDVNFAPYTPSQQDQGAAAELRDINAYYDQKFDMQSEWLDWTSNAMIVSSWFRKIRWDPTADALTWTHSLQPDGSTQLVIHDAKGVGDIDECLVPSYEMFPDPRTRGSWDDAAYLIHCKLMPLSWFQANFGKRGQRVQADIGGQINTWADAVLDAISGDFYRGDPNLGGQAYYYEMWEKPTDRFPEGRMVPVGGKTLLVEEGDVDWPYDKKDEYPFVELSYGAKRQSVWGYNIVHDLIQSQRALNQVWSRFLDRVYTQKITILAPRTSKLAVGAYQSRRNFEIIKFDGGIPPAYQVPPLEAESYMTAITSLIARMEALAGAERLAEPGEGIPNVTSAAGLQIVRDESVARSAGMVTRIERAAKRVAVWRGSHAKQFYAEPRYLAVSQQPDLQSADQAARDFRNLTSGGRVHVWVKDGSAVPKSAAAQDQFVLDMSKAGMFEPANLAVTKAVVGLTSLNSSDVLKGEIGQVVDQQLALAREAQQQPLQLAAQQQEHEAAAQLQKHQFDMELQGAKVQGAVALQQEKTSGQGQLIGIENAWELHAAQAENSQPKISMTIAAKAGPTATASAEEALGLESDSAAELKPILTPPVPQAGVGARKTAGNAGKPS